MSKALGTMLDVIFRRSGSDRQKDRYLAARARLTDVDKAEALSATTSPSLRPLFKQYKTAWTEMDWLAEMEQYKRALAQVARVQQAINELIAEEQTSQTQALLAVNKVNSLGAGDLKAQSNASKIRLLEQLRGPADMTPEQRRAQHAVYQAMDLDEEFLRHDAEKREQIAGAMTDTLEKRNRLRKLRLNWNKRPAQGGPTKEQKLQLMRDAIAVQCQALGIDPPPEVKEVNQPRDPSTGLIENGYFNPEDGKIYINVHPASAFHRSMEQALDLALHENSHKYQDVLVNRLKDGSLTPGEPEYEQALLFQANAGLRGYVKGEEDYATYKKQPLEEHAFENGPKTAKAILKKL